MAAAFLDLVRMSLGMPFNFTQWQALQTDVHGHADHSESSSTNQTTIKLGPIMEKTIDPSLESWSFNPSDVGKKPVNRHPQSSDNSTELSQSATLAKSSRDTTNNLHNDKQLNTSEIPNIVSNDGEISLVINHRLIDAQRNIIGYCNKRESLQRKLNHVGKELTSLEDNISRLEKCMYDADGVELTDEEKPAQLDVDLQDQQNQLRDACERRDALQWELDVVNISYEGSRDVTQDLLKEFLAKASLLNVPERDHGSDLSSQITPGANCSSQTSTHSASNFVSVSELFRRGVVEELDKRRKIFHEMEDGFNERYQDLAKGLAEYQQDVHEGLCDMPRSEFDRRALKAMMQRTTALIDAEVFLEQVKSRARALGLLRNEWEQDSQFLDEEDDGYRVSFEAYATGGVNRDAIEAWFEEVIETDDVEIRRDAETDEWDAKSLEIGDSISCVDYTKNGYRIDRWRKKCERKDCDDCEVALVKSCDSGNDECLDQPELQSNK